MTGTRLLARRRTAARARREAPHDRKPLTWRQRVTWLRFTLRFSRDVRKQIRAIDRIQAEIAETERRLRDCLGEGGGA